jgi:protease II
LDENELAASPEHTDPNASFFRLGFLRHSADCALIAYGIDPSGTERYTTHFKDLNTGEKLTDIVPDCYEDFEFDPSGQYVFYIKIDAYERAFQWTRHLLGTAVDEDVALYVETDEMHCLTMTKSSNKRYTVKCKSKSRFLFLNSSAQVTSETRFIDLRNPESEPRIIFPRREKVSYTIEHHFFTDAEPGSQEDRGWFYVMTNENAKNNMLYRVPVPDTAWPVDGMALEDALEMRESVIDSRDFVLIEAFQLRARHLIVFERSNCMQNIRVLNLDASTSLGRFRFHAQNTLKRTIMFRFRREPFILYGPVPSMKRLRICQSRRSTRQTRCGSRTLRSRSPSKSLITTWIHVNRLLYTKNEFLVPAMMHPNTLANVYGRPVWMAPPYPSAWSTARIY